MVIFSEVVFWLIVLLVKGKKGQVIGSNEAVEIATGQTLDLEGLGFDSKTKESIEETKEEQKEIANNNPIKSWKDFNLEEVEQSHQLQLADEISQKHGLQSNFNNWVDTTEESAGLKNDSTVENMQTAENKQPTEKDPIIEKIRQEASNLNNDEIWSDDTVKNILDKIHKFRNSGENK